MVAMLKAELLYETQRAWCAFLRYSFSFMVTPKQAWASLVKHDYALGALLVLIHKASNGPS